MLETTSLIVTGMKCGGCENNVTTKLKTLDGINSVTASSKDKAVNVEFDNDKIDLKAIAKAITAAGYTVVEDI